MSIQIKHAVGDILSLQRGIFVHGCNCGGEMGSGIALLVKQKWRAVFDAYRHVHANHGLILGDIVPVSSNEAYEGLGDKHGLFLVNQPSLPPDLIVVNAMTQFDYGRTPGRVYVDYDAVSAAFWRIRMLARDTGLPVHFPLIGCGLAQGKWEEVSKRISEALGPQIEATLWTLPGVEVPVAAAKQSSLLD